MGEAAERRVLVGRYEIVGLLGRGGMGTVYRGRDLELGRSVAVKLLEARLSTEAAALTRFRREARSAARLNHPNVVTVYDSGVDHGDHYIVMELVPGGTLNELLRERGALPLPLALGIADDVLQALAAAHDAGLVHRDVSPGNVMITREGTAKVTDFGIARAFGPDAEHTGSIAGTAAYLAPEQAVGEAVTPAADLYGVGCMLYAMLTGRPPFGGGDALTVAHRHLEQQTQPPSAVRAGLPSAVDALVLRALEKRPEDRFASAQEMRRALAASGVRIPPAGSRDVWRTDEEEGAPQSAVTRISAPSERRGDTAVWPAAAGAAADAVGAGAAASRTAARGGRGSRFGTGPRSVAYAGAARPPRRPGPPPDRHLSRPLIAVIAALVIAASVLVLLAATGSLSSSRSGVQIPGGDPGAAGPATGAPASAAPATTPPATTAPATTAPTSPATPEPGGGGGNPGKGPKKDNPGKGQDKNKGKDTSGVVVPLPASSTTAAVTLLPSGSSSPPAGIAVLLSPV